MADEPREPREPRPPATFDEELLGAEVESIVSTQSDAARAQRVHGELAEGFRALARVGAAVSIFGSARTPRDHPEYALARETARSRRPRAFGRSRARARIPGGRAASGRSRRSTPPPPRAPAPESLRRARRARAGRGRRPIGSRRS